MDEAVDHPLLRAMVAGGIGAVVPHRGRMLLVDRLLAHDEDAVVVEAVVDLGNPFADAQGVPPWIGIEYMAQAISAWAGCRALLRGEPVRIGFLLGTRRYHGDARPFAIGARLRIEARREIFGDNGMGLFSCRILEQGVERARAQVSVFEPPGVETAAAGLSDPAAFLQGEKP